MDDGEIYENNQLALVQENSIQKSPIPVKTGRLRPAAIVFTPNSSKIERTNPYGKGTEVNYGLQKETTAQWVSRTFVGNVATNQSCQEVLSQSIDTNV